MSKSTMMTGGTSLTTGTVSLEEDEQSPPRFAEKTPRQPSFASGRPGQQLLHRIERAALICSCSISSCSHLQTKGTRKIKKNNNKKKKKKGEIIK
jgi:hypothetical protein